MAATVAATPANTREHARTSTTEPRLIDDELPGQHHSLPLDNGRSGWTNAAQSRRLCCYMGVSTQRQTCPRCNGQERGPPNSPTLTHTAVRRILGLVIARKEALEASRTTCVSKARVIRGVVFAASNRQVIDHSPRSRSGSNCLQVSDEVVARRPSPSRRFCALNLR